jgi:hypothetical protein
MREDALYLADRMEALNVSLGGRQEELTSLVIHGPDGQTSVLLDGGTTDPRLAWLDEHQDALAAALRNALAGSPRGTTAPA